MQNIWLRRIWILLALSITMGTASSIFLWGLDEIKQVRESNHWLLYFLPVLGIGLHCLYQKNFLFAKTGTNDLVEKLNSPNHTVDTKVGPFIFLSTWLSHLVGASVGREGTAVLMGGSFGSLLGKVFYIHEEEKNTWIRAGISAGFASVFGTPLAGAFFGLEISQVGKINSRDLIPCLLAGFLANWTSLHVYGTKHALYPHIFLPSISTTFCASILCISLILGIIGFLYTRLESVISKAFDQLPRNFYLRGLVSGFILLVLFQFPIFHESIGLGSEFLVRPFHEFPPIEFSLTKSLATLLSLGLGFKGGEATPIFLIGSHASASFYPLLNIPLPLLAGIGFTSLYGGLCKTPLAATCMGMELFGTDAAICYLICTLLVMYISGKKGIFKSQIWNSSIPKPLY
ncbi:chloride channel protein [Aquirufa sp. ROCK2-A2]